MTSATKTSKSILTNKNPNVLPLLKRKSSVSFSSEVDNDDEAERSRRRIEAEMQKNTSNTSIAQSAHSALLGSDFTGQNLQDHFNTCLQMFLQNKINSKNVWSLHIFEYMTSLVQTNTDVREMLQVAGTSFDIGAKVYSLRVDDIHCSVLKLASSLANIYKQNVSNDAHSDEEGNGDHNQDSKSPAKKKRKAHTLNFNERRITVYDNENSLNSDIPKLLNDKVVTDSTSNYLNLTLPKVPYGFQLLVKHRCRDFSWCNPKIPESLTRKEFRNKLSGLREPLPPESICPTFNGFAVDHWDVSNEEDQLDCSRQLDEIMYDDDGLPIPQLDDDLHENDANNNLLDDDIITDMEFRSENAHANEQFEFITDMKPELTDPALDGQSLEYSYRSIPNDSLFNRMWAGPLHWKLKHIRRPNTPAILTESGTKTARTKKQLGMVNFDDISLEDVQRDVRPSNRPMTRSNLTCDESYFTLPEDKQLRSDEFMFRVLDLDKYQSIKYMDTSVGTSGINRINGNHLMNGEMNQEEENNMENHFDSFNNSDLNNSSLNSPHDGLLASPSNLVKKDWVTYALKAKRFDMKKLKTAIWEELTKDEKGKSISGEVDSITPTTLRKVYDELPKRLSEHQMENVSCSLAFVALLHLSNEHGLMLNDVTSLSDVVITKNSS